MSEIRRVESFLAPRDAEQITGLSRSRLARLAQRGRLSNLRTEGGHRRYKLSELQALRQQQGRIRRDDQRHIIE